MKNTLYIKTGLSSLIAFVLLIIMYFSWPLVDFSLNDVILGNVELSKFEKNKIIESIGYNYALDTIFIFTWVGAWCGLYIHFKKITNPLIRVSFFMSVLGAFLDLFENTISFSLLVNSFKNNSISDILFYHSLIRDLSFWLPMLASFIVSVTIPIKREVTNVLLVLSGTLGVVLAILGMYIQSLSYMAYCWFVLWFFVVALFLLKRGFRTNQ